MDITVTIDDELYQQALDMADAEMDPAALLQEALKTFVHLQAARRLAALGGCCSACAPRPPAEA